MTEFRFLPVFKDEILSVYAGLGCLDSNAL